MSGRTRLLVILGLYIFLGISWRIAYLSEYSASPLFRFPCGPDVEEYDSRAREIIAGKPLWDSPEIHAPLYPFFLAALYKATGFGHFAARLVQSSLGFLSAIPLILLMLRHGVAGRRTVAFFAILWLFYPPGVFYQAEYISESLCIILVNLSLFLLYLADIRPGSARGLMVPLAGLLCGLAVITHPLCAIFPASVFIYWLLSYLMRREKIFIRKAAAFLVPVVICSAPVAAYNWAALDSGFTVQANGGFNFFLGNNPESDGTCYLRPGRKWVDTHREAERHRDSGQGSKDSFFLKKSLDFIAEHPLDWAMLTARKFLLCWNFRELNAGADTWSIRHFTDFQRLLSWSGGIIQIFGLAGFLLSLKYSRTIYSLRYFLLLLVSFWLAQTIFVSSGRYRYPALPAVIILCSFALDYFCTRLRGFKFAIYDIAAFSLAFIVVLLPLAGGRSACDDAESDSIIGEAYLKAGDLGEAERRLLASSKVLGDSSRPWNLLGIINMWKGRPSEAEGYFHKAAAVDPFDSDALMNLAVISSDRGQSSEAENLFASAMAMNPDSPVLLFNYGFHLQKMRRYAEAEEYYRRCILRSPANGPALLNLGFLMMENGDFAAAEELYTRALALCPEDPRIMSNLAAAKSETGKKAEAEELFKKAEKKRKDLIRK